ncbi:Bacterial regulatory protein, tetR family [Pseudovibrio axinellae]|uniref:Bacterial regulatory protein, tetR family n=1 Tax=Pseudovibrio axinellae TaxID=989403 RepID=A0A166AA99_9HYPH|nr:TetR family transcriptional regulator [Pseudovibrio axinellae]KZL20782.1 Bacterial regulatory protein, tetR family [Pseudovibrio axinellae]SER22764.1 transcriptional regulator, TetR family [Pseudovibrio axinellae]
MGRPAKSKMGLSKDRIYAQAMLLLDESGEQAVTFRELAARLNVTAMAITHHVGTRKELFGQLIDQAYDGVGEAPEPLKGREALVHVLEDYCQRVIAHPALMQSILMDSSLMPSPLLRLTDQIRHFVESTPCEKEEVETLVNLIADYTHGFAISAAANPGDAEGAPGVRVEDYRRGLEWVLAKLG